MGKLTEDQYKDALRALRLLITDVDGVLTDGSIIYAEDSAEAKVFNVRDGSAMYIARCIGLPVAVITARTSAAVARRFSEVPVHSLLQGTFDKRGACVRLQEDLGISSAEVGYVGDDLVDLPVMAHVGLAITVADGHPRVRDRANWVTQARGGRGALREVVDDIVTARDQWDVVERDYERRQSADEPAVDRDHGAPRRAGA